MGDSWIRGEAREDFNRARTREALGRLLTLVWPQRTDLLSFEEVKDLLQPRSQSYRGMRAVPLNLIVGSEGRYRDFNKQFLPRHEHLRQRWTSVDSARLRDVILPAVQLYELGGVYFVRDGNHRVSVARMMGVHAIDAEVVSLGTEISLHPDMNRADLLQAVLDYEYRRFLEQSRLHDVLPDVDLRLSSPGQYAEILSHVHVHKYFLNQGQKNEIPFAEALVSWYRTVYRPIIDAIDAEGILRRFRQRTEADLYVWIVKHWHYLKEQHGSQVSVEEAAQSFGRLYGRPLLDRIRDWFVRTFSRSGQ